MSDNDFIAILDQHRLFDGDGRIVRWPTKQSHIQAVLEYLAAKFEVDTIYTEAQVNQILKQWHTFEDWPLLRRALIDNSLMERNRSGSEYKRIK